MSRSSVSGPAHRVVYTALMGGYEELLEQPAAKDSSIPFVCFTDDPSMRSDDWEIRLVEPLFGADSIRSSRALKIMGHPSLSHYDESLWIDNRVLLLTDPGKILDSWLDGADLAVPRHSYRTDVVSEFQAVLDLGLDEAARLYEQLTHYTALQRDLLGAPAPWTGMLARRRTPAVDAAMQRWLQHVLRYSRRDQLSFVQTMHEAGSSWSSVELDNLSSELHEWRWPAGRSTRPMAFRVADSLQPPIAALGEQRLAFDQTLATMASALEQQEEAMRALQGEVAELHEQHAFDQAQVKRLRRRVRRARRKKLDAERRLARDNVWQTLVRRGRAPRDQR